MGGVVLMMLVVPVWEVLKGERVSQLTVSQMLTTLHHTYHQYLLGSVARKVVTLKHLVARLVRHGLGTS